MLFKWKKDMHLALTVGFLTALLDESYFFGIIFHSKTLEQQKIEFGK